MKHPIDFDDLPTDELARPRLLLVEDDASFREIVAVRMRRVGFEVIEVDSGFDAVDATADGFDLAVMDVQIPGVSGLEIARMLRTAGWTVPIVLMTAFPDAHIVAEATRLHLSLLAKPFPLDQLSDTAIAALQDTLE